MKFKHFIPPFLPQPPTVESGEIAELTELWQYRFTAWHYVNREKTNAESFSFQTNDGAPPGQDIPSHLINLNLPGGRSYVIGHLWLTPEETTAHAESLKRTHPLEGLYLGTEPVLAQFNLTPELPDEHDQ